MARKQLDPERTRNGILESAFHLFAQRGYAGVSTADIAEMANVPKSLILYHFGTKEDLWRQCLLRNIGGMLQAADRVLEGEGSLVDLARARIATHRTNPEVGRLLVWGSLEPVPIPEEIQQRVQAVRAKLASDPNRLKRLILAFATIDGWFLHRHLYTTISGANQAEIEAELEHVIGSLEEDHE